MGILIEGNNEYKQPVLCASGAFFIRKYIKEIIEVIYSGKTFEVDDMCKYYERLYEIFNNEEVNNWCDEYSNCGSYKVLAYCYHDIASLILKIAAGVEKIDIGDYEASASTASIVLIYNDLFEENGCVE